MAVTAVAKRNSAPAASAAALQVVGCELGIAHVSGLRGEHRPGKLFGGVGPEVGIVGPFGRAEDSRVEDRHPLDQLVGGPLLVGHADGVEVGKHLQVVAAGILQGGHAALLVCDEAQFVGGFEVRGPVEPVLQALVGHGHAGVGRVGEAHDGARVDGRAEARGRQLVYAQHPAAPPPELEGGGRTDHACADHHRVERVVPGVYAIRCPGLGRRTVPARRIGPGAPSGAGTLGGAAAVRCRVGPGARLRCRGSGGRRGGQMPRRRSSRMSNAILTAPRRPASAAWPRAST